MNSEYEVITDILSLIDKYVEDRTEYLINTIVEREQYCSLVGSINALKHLKKDVIEVSSKYFPQIID